MRAGKSVMAALLMMMGTSVLAEEHLASEKDGLELFVDKNLLVESATRNMKPLSQVAENVSVITAAEIKAINAHTLAEVLQRVPGVFVDSAGQDLGSMAQIQIQGSKDTHVLLLIDEVPFNFISGGNAESNWIPLDIIDRIEIIKGPASSTWGSALGGIVNVITKKPKDDKNSSGSVQGALGEHGTFDGRAQMLGGNGYFLYAGYQHTDGLLNGRDFDNPTFFGKISRAPRTGLALTASLGVSTPEADNGDLRAAGIRSKSTQKVLFGTFATDFTISESATGHAMIYGSNHVLTQKNNEDGQYGPDGSLFRDMEFDESQLGGGARVAWILNRHSMVAGVDYNYGKLEQTSDNGAYLTSMGAPPDSRTTPHTKHWGLYFNDTITLGALSVIPGVRFDDTSGANSFLSPSLGATYRPWKSTLFRLSAARGFTNPGLADTRGGGLFMDPNHELKPETVWSYQLGVETNALKVIWLKASLFRHDLSDAITYVTSKENPNNISPTNHGEIQRTGAELELETIPFGGFSFYGGSCYVFVDPSGDNRNRTIYTIDGGLRYQGALTQADMHGHRVEWDMPDDAFKGEYDDVIWDLNVSRTVKLFDSGGVTLFGTVHNIFDGEQYSTATYPNPGRWFEVGGRVGF